MQYFIIMQWLELDELLPTGRTPSDDDDVESFELGNADGHTLLATAPGSHWADTSPPGGDFDVTLRAGDVETTVSYSQVFSWIEEWSLVVPLDARIVFLRALGSVILEGADPFTVSTDIADTSPRPASLLLGAVQALALSEQRRFGDTDSQGGGRRLAAELTLGILLDRWTVAEAAEAASSGHVGLLQLRHSTQHHGLLPFFPDYVELMDKALPVPSVPRTVDAIVDVHEEAKLRAEALEHLRTMAGGDADFRPQQWETIKDLVIDRKRLLLVQRTGWGKSAVYFIATRLLRDRGAGPTILISPLLSLMRNQVEMAERAGIRAATLNASNETEHLQVYRSMADDQVDVLLVTPEWVSKPDFRANVLPSMGTAAMVVIDEVHCISDWGHDFRPDYRRIIRLLDGLDEAVPVLGTTATATKRVIVDIEAQFGDGFQIVKGSLARPGLAFAVFAESSKASRLARLLEIVRASSGTGIVYCLTIPETKRVADFLISEGVNARQYHAKLEDEDRRAVEAGLRDSDVDVVVATSALGMGFDKPDIEYVVHFQSPSSIIEYYQQAGRAGRGIPKARAVLMVSRGDESIHSYFSNLAFVTEREAELVLKTIQERGRATVAQLESSINIESERIQKAVKVLDVEGAIAKAGYSWVVADRGWKYDTSRPERVTAQRRLERLALYSYAASDRCRVETLMLHLDDPNPTECGECDNCLGEHDGKPSADIVTSVDSFLAGFRINIAPKKYAPATSRNGPYPIPRHAWGRALTFLGEGEIGRLADDAITRRLPFHDSVLDASVDLLEGWRFKGNQEPGWVSFVPKDEDGDFLEDFAERLAGRIGKSFRPGLRKTRETRSELELNNDVQRYENLSFAFEPTSEVRPEPVLLVDDMISSGWTFAVTAMTLRKQGGVGAVVPFAVTRVL